ncbi:NAD(P)/FAD-dependent oxidoreductase [Gynuella sunshinyii]|uniref:Glycine/D-amino acid oxidase (Deaminating) n=1 Tax=Gynuella sunshinyii YC6258 TaxID=1445510 RepID=A0A0C5W3Y4_9GAMM|nr:FAD-binding oxidoreductase [Gynuella sunshinyii]AJQ97329.1 glycine/D-amino acid oxidase (deaminating) [Gynuella sunshinyii YC6258]
MYLNPSIHGNQHPDSYYFATLRYPQSYPLLQHSIDVDTCVIGAGFSGINTAIELADRGRSVAVLEARKVGWGASGRNGGQVLRGIGHDLEQFRNQIGEQGVDTIARMGLEAVDVVLDRIQRFSIDCDVQRGSCDLATKPRHMRDFSKDYEWLKSVGYQYDVELLPADRIREVVGADAYMGGLLDRGGVHLHPLNLIAGEAAAAAAMGVQIFEDSPVIRIEEGERIRVHTEKGIVSASQLVICANGYVSGLHPELDSRVLPTGTYIVATEPLSDEQCKRILPQNTAVCDQNVALDYYRLSADNRLLFGGRCTYSGRDPKSIRAIIQPRMVRLFPWLKDVKIDYEWGGMLGIGANRLPQIGRLRPNIYYAQAYAGHGVAASHIAAQLMAECICLESNRIEVFERVRHMKFPGGPLLRSPLLALGMMYYRFVDLF